MLEIMLQDIKNLEEEYKSKFDKNEGDEVVENITSTGSDTPNTGSNTPNTGSDTPLSDNDSLTKIENMEDEYKSKIVENKEELVSENEGDEVFSTVSETSNTIEKIFKDKSSSNSSFSFSSNKVPFCNYCKKIVDTENCLKTKIKGKKGFETIYFCFIDCFTKQNKWPKKHYKKNSKKSVKRNKKNRN